MKFKTLPAAYKAPPTYSAEPRTFEAIVSVFNNVDHGGDIVRPGAFADTIAAWKSSGDTLPVLWSHRMDDPNYNIGGVVDIDELQPGDVRIPEWANSWVRDNGGLWVKAEVDEDGVAAQVWNLMVKRRVTQFSFAYDVIEERQTRDGNELMKLWLHEIGPTPLGMNPLTELLGAKADTPPETPETPPEPEPPADEPDPAPPPSRKAAGIRLRCEIAAMWHEHTDYQSR